MKTGGVPYNQVCTIHHVAWITVAGFVLDLVIRLGLSLRVIKRRLPVGIALAWLAVILVLPFVGAIFYLLVGEYRLGRRRTRRAAELAQICQQWSPRPQAERQVDGSGKGAASAALARVTEAALGCFPLTGN